MAEPDEFNDEPTREIEAAPPLAEADDGSPLAALKRERAKIAEQTTEDFELPNNEGLLWATYKVLPFKTVQTLSRRAAESDHPEAELYAAADLLGDACVRISLREDGELSPLGDDPDVPVRFDERLVTLLEFGDPPPGKRGGPGEWTVRAIVRRTLLRDVSVVAHQQDVLRWMQGANAKASDAYAGE